MLIEFRLKNYKSFGDDAILSLVPAPKQKGLDYSLLTKRIGRKIYKSVCSAVIYGPNASGKTNIIGAMETFKNIIIRGDIRDRKDMKSLNAASTMLALIPNQALKGLPVSLGITFITDGFLADYDIKLDLGNFLDDDYQRMILNETLRLNNFQIFTRDRNTLSVDTDNLKRFRKYLLNDFNENIESAVKLAQNSLNSAELFLKNGFKTMFSPKITSLLSDWFEEKFNVIYHSALLRPTEFSDLNIMNEIVHQLGLNSIIMKYHSDKDKEKNEKLYSAFTDETGSIKKGVLSEAYESYGTIRLINLLPMIISVMKSGGVLVADELDASIHPKILMNIINIFHDSSINVNKAQLIFNTHNPVFLNHNLFRRDEIKFTEINESSGNSTLYSLSDFGTEGRFGVRRNEDYMKEYFVDKYGAICDVDFSSMLRIMLGLEATKHDEK